MSELGPVGIVDLSKVIKEEPIHPVCDRLTVQMGMYHEHCGEQPTSVQCHFSAMLETVVQPYSRRLSVGTGWVPLDLGWMETPGYLVLQNTTGLGRNRNPTEDELNELKKKVIEVSVEGTSIFVIRPGRFLMAEITGGGGGFAVRSAYGAADLKLTIMPR